MENFGHNDKYWSEHAVNDDFGVVSAGYYHITRIDVATYRPKGLRDWQFLYCKSGQIHMNDRTNPFLLQAGHAILFRPHEYQEYVYKQEDGTEGYFVHFGGHLTSKIIERIGLSDFTMGPIEDTHMVETSIAKIIETLQRKRLAYDEEAIAQLLLFLTELSRSLSAGTRNETENTIHYICEQMRTNYNRNLANEYYANLCNMSLSHFLRVFKQVTGVSPQKYVLDLQLYYAEGLLTDTNYKIEYIAHLVGINDPMYFSRIFRKYRGMTPSQFRKTTKRI